ncbi:MAG TPA: PDZ domain-containing protein, partial [Acidimicrobiales bacterium]|nr:PDZ domain-containing protein [Acidimicrobiales bacterium]
DAPAAETEVYGHGPGRGRGSRGGGAPFRWRKRHTFGSIFAVLVVAAVVAYFIQLPFYAITPGSAPAVSSLITVPASHRHSHRGSVLLVYVELTPMRALYYPFFWLDPNAAIDSSGSILGSETTAQYATEGEIDMSTAQQAATVVALTQLGYKVPVVALGALVYGILPGSPAADAALQVGDVISKVNGAKVPTYLGLADKLEGFAPGTTVHLVAFAYPAGKPRTVTLRLGAFRVVGVGNNATVSCFSEGKGTRYKIWKVPTVTGGKPHAIACLGIYPQGSGGVAVDGTAFKVGPLPVKVNLSSEGIVGPSAGLAFTLGLMQELDPADLTGGLKVAASGTMSIDGSVGDVGGVAQKTIAVRGAGATVFFVPVQEYAVAKSKAGPNLKVYAVSSIDQVIKILESLGGRIVRTTAG